VYGSGVAPAASAAARPLLLKYRYPDGADRRPPAIR
jgi:hypothetical protein